jgi:hypothetical protein
VPTLINALEYYKLPTIGAQTKKEMRELAMRGPPFTYEELVALILLRHIFLREFRGKLRAHAGHRGSRAWPIA